MSSAKYTRNSVFLEIQFILQYKYVFEKYIINKGSLRQIIIFFIWFELI